MLYVKLNLDGLIPLFNSLTKRELQKIIKRASQHAARKGKTYSVEEASRVYNLKKKEIRSRIFNRLNLGTPDEPLSKIVFRFKDIPLDRFNNTTKWRYGMKVKVKKAEGVKTLRSAFRAQGKRVYVRKSGITESTQEFISKVPSKPITRSKKNYELPIVRLRASGLAETMLPYAPKITQVTGEEGQKELERQLNLLLGR